MYAVFSLPVLLSEPEVIEYNQVFKYKFKEKMH